MADPFKPLGKQSSNYKEPVDSAASALESVDKLVSILDSDNVDSIGDGEMQIGYDERLEMLAKQCRDTDLKIDQLENQLKDAKASMFKLTREIIPDVMAEMGMTNATLATGTSINVKQRYDAKYAKKPNSKDVDEEKKLKFHEWMRQNGFGGMIKSQFIVQVDPEVTEVFRQICEKIGLEAEYKENTIHYKTLESWAKEQTEAGRDLPNNLIELWIGREAIVK